MREWGWILQMKDEVLGVFVWRNQPEVFTGEEVNLI
jgi:hypothetical protein